MIAPPQSLKGVLIMISSTLKIIGCLFVVSFIVHAQNPPPKTQPGSISGKVTLKGNGVAGIVVGARLTTQSGPRARSALMTTTDQQGNYRLANVSPGQYELMPAAPQYVLADQVRTNTLIVAEGENLENVDFALVRGGVVTGKVVDADGKPLIEQAVQLFAIGGPEGNPMVLTNIFAGATDDRGVYRAYGLRPGKYRVAAGTAEDSLSYGLGGPSVYEQTYHPSATKESEATLIEVTEGSEATNVDITLRHTLKVFTVYARVVDENGQPLPNVSYGLQKTRENGSSSSSGFVTNSRGEIRLDNVLPGKYALFLEPSAQRESYVDPVQFEVVDQDIKDLVLRAAAGSSVSGVVVLEGLDDKVAAAKLAQLMVLAHIQTKDRYFSGSSPNAVVSADGSFKVTGLRAGVVQFAIWGRGPGSMAPIDITQIDRDGVVQPTLEIKGGEQVKGVRLIVRQRTGRIRGLVKFENGPILSARAHVMVTKAGENSGLMLQLDDRGRFISDPLPAGVYEIRVIAYPPHGRSVTTKQQVAVTDDQVSEVVLTLNIKDVDDDGP
jgi:protocatechuate 3,4-dioxygenase beta subunit